MPSSQYSDDERPSNRHKRLRIGAPSKPGIYKVNHKWLLLTYPKVDDDFDAQELINHLHNLWKLKSKKKEFAEELQIRLKVGLEYHEDGARHYHVLVDFQKIFITHDVHIFDICGKHPHIQPVHVTPERAHVYIANPEMKPHSEVILDEFPSFDSFDLEPQSARPKEDPKLSKKDQRWGTIFKAKSFNEAMDMAREFAPGDLATSFYSVQACLNHMFRMPMNEHTDPLGLVTDLSQYPELDQWREQNLRLDYGKPHPHRPQSLVLYGATRLGKTLWARSLMGKHVYFSLLFNLDQYEDDVDYAIFDDLQGGMEYWPAYKGWLGGQMRFNVTDKYRHKVKIDWGRPCIYLANSDPQCDPKVDIEWLNGNCTFVEITSPIAWVDRELARVQADEIAQREAEEAVGGSSESASDTASVVGSIDGSVDAEVRSSPASSIELVEEDDEGGGLFVSEDEAGPSDHRRGTKCKACIFIEDECEASDDESETDPALELSDFAFIPVIPSIAFVHSSLSACPTLAVSCSNRDFPNRTTIPNAAFGDLARSSAPVGSLRSPMALLPVLRPPAVRIALQHSADQRGL
ncbi:hypothetical protein F4604DRAFT_1918604 [Suillus subluteus]|nr:hypothetical protein F4604DRAFT_1918604 [Suillus subluteus]